MNYNITPKNHFTKWCRLKYEQEDEHEANLSPEHFSKRSIRCSFKHDKHQFSEFKNPMNIARQYQGLSGTYQCQSLKMSMLTELHVAAVACSCHSTELKGVETWASFDCHPLLHHWWNLQHHNCWWPHFPIQTHRSLQLTCHPHSDRWWTSCAQSVLWPGSIPYVKLFLDFV